MKTTFNIHGSFERCFIDANIDVPKLVNAIQANLGAAKPLNPDGENKRSAVRGVEKDVNLAFSENSKIDYRGKMDAAGKFATYHDAQCAVWKKHGEPAGELTIDALPVSQRDWLVLTFSLTAEQIAAKVAEQAAKDAAQAKLTGEPTPQSPEPAAKGNGAHKRNAAPATAKA